MIRKDGKEYRTEDELLAMDEGADEVIHNIVKYDLINEAVIKMFRERCIAANGLQYWPVWECWGKFECDNYDLATGFLQREWLEQLEPPTKWFDEFDEVGLKEFRRRHTGEC